MSEFGGQQPAPQQVLDLGVSTEGVFNEIEMGVLQNGISYLTQNGLARICGVHRSNIADISREWEETSATEFSLEGVWSLSAHIYSVSNIMSRLFISQSTKMGQSIMRTQK